MHQNARHTVPVEEACRLHDRAVAYRERSQLAKAKSLGLKALAILEREAGPQHPDVANILNHLGGVRADGGDYAGAETFYLRSVAIMEKLGRLAAGDHDLARLLVQSLNNLGSLYRLRGRYAEAEPLLKRALRFAEKAFPRGDLEISSTLNNLAVLYKYQHRFAAAERLYRRALSMIEKALGPEVEIPIAVEPEPLAVVSIPIAVELTPLAVFPLPTSVNDNSAQFPTLASSNEAAVDQQFHFIAIGPR